MSNPNPDSTARELQQLKEYFAKAEDLLRAYDLQRTTLSSPQRGILPIEAESVLRKVSNLRSDLSELWASLEGIFSIACSDLCDIPGTECRFSFDAVRGYYGPQDDLRKEIEARMRDERVRVMAELARRGNSAVEDVGDAVSVEPREPSDYERYCYYAHAAARDYLIGKHNVIKPLQSEIYEALRTAYGNEIEVAGTPDSFTIPSTEAAFLKAYRRARNLLAKAKPSVSDK
ncbi:hypothetical protein [Rosistilla oblonga]|uniref:hypothetical protein n=1 Tax=Rosistilla oblonga TaxID=2527990 RepID=UPI003A970617